MITSMDSKEIKRIQRIAIPQMNQLEIPISPENYALWFLYSSGTNSELVEIINTMLSKGEPFTKETLFRLFEEFCEEISGDELLRLREELQTMVTELYKSVGDFVGQSSGWGNTLVDAAARMAEAETVHEINEIVSELVSQTKEFGEQSKQISCELDLVQNELTALKKTLTTLQEEIRHDSLTGISNRKAFDEALERQISLSRRRERCFSLLMVDIDYFKKVNDTYGHLIGDEVLQFVAQSMESRLRKEDMVARFGGEEFVIILPETHREQAVLVAEQLRGYFAHTHMIREHEPHDVGKITISIGLTEYRDNEPANDLLTRADYALYTAKENGRNQVRWK